MFCFECLQSSFFLFFLWNLHKKKKGKLFRNSRRLSQRVSISFSRRNALRISREVAWRIAFIYFKWKQTKTFKFPWQLKWKTKMASQKQNSKVKVLLFLFSPAANRPNSKHESQFKMSLFVCVCVCFPLFLRFVHDNFAWQFGHVLWRLNSNHRSLCSPVE